MGLQPRRGVLRLLAQRDVGHGRRGGDLGRGCLGLRSELGRVPRLSVARAWLWRPERGAEPLPDVPDATHQRREGGELSIKLSNQDVISCDKPCY